MLMTSQYMLFDSRGAFDAALAAINQRDGFTAQGTAEDVTAEDVTVSWAPVQRDAAGRYVLEVPPGGIPESVAGFVVGQPALPCAVVP
jgi:hypothetical protein